MKKGLLEFVLLLSVIGIFASSPLDNMPFRKEVDTSIGIVQYKNLYRQFPEASTIFYDSVSLPGRSGFLDVIPIYSDSFHQTQMEGFHEDIDFKYNRIVQRFIDIYTVEKRNIGRVVSGKMPYYEQIFEQILAENNVPQCLKYLCIVESGINPYAVSKSGATGIWQFMHGTGKYLDLKITYFRDDRRDIYESTDAAAKYLKSLHERFGDWLLAIAAYNCGPGNMNKAIRKSGGMKDFWSVRKYLPRETRNYVPAFIAVNYMMEKRSMLNIIPAEPSTYHYPFTARSIDHVVVRQKISFSSISKVLDIPMNQLSFLNPGIKKNIIPFSKEGYKLRLPCDKVPLYNELVDSILYEEQVYSASIGDAYYYDRDKISYRVKSGDNLSVIAKRHSCSVTDLMDWNDLRSTSIFINQKLVVFIGEDREQAFASRKVASSKSNNISKEGFVYYTIERGDTLWSISKKFPGVAMDSIRRDNQIYNVHSLQPGTVLKIGLASNG